MEREKDRSTVKHLMEAYRAMNADNALAHLCQHLDRLFRQAVENGYLTEQEHSDIYSEL
jgi:hypothetical protein